MTYIAFATVIASEAKQSDEIIQRLEIASIAMTTNNEYRNPTSLYKQFHLLLHIQVSVLLVHQGGLGRVIHL